MKKTSLALVAALAALGSVTASPVSYACSKTNPGCGASGCSGCSGCKGSCKGCTGCGGCKGE